MGEGLDTGGEAARPGGARTGRRFATAMFTDIAGSTAYYTLKGDDAGRDKVHRHDRLLHPIAERHGGEVIAHTGDGMLALFDQPEAACRAAVEMQQAIELANRDIPEREDELHVRIALHAGVGLREAHNMYGNFINITSRIEQLAAGDQILISDEVYAGLDRALAGRCAFFEERGLRGSDALHRLYEVLWRPDALLATRHSIPEPPRDERAAREGMGWTVVHLDLDEAPGLAERFPETISSILARYRTLVETVGAEFGGQVVESRAGSAFLSFPSAVDACLAAAAVLDRLDREPWNDAWPGVGRLQPRAAVHTAPSSEGNEAGILERAARLNSAGHAGQILLTSNTVDAVAGDLPPTVRIDSWGTRTLQDQRHVESVFELVASDSVDPSPPLRVPSQLDAGQRIRLEPGAPSGDAEALLADLRMGTGTVTLPPEQAAELARQRPATLDSFRLGRLVHWSQPRYRIDARFVELTMLVDRGEDAEGDRWTTRSRPIETVSELLREVSDPAMVVLGPPGAGKSTILRRLELEASFAAIRNGNEAAPVTLYLPLRQFRAGDDPATWVARSWENHSPDLPPLAEFLSTGSVLFLADGLNEMSVTGPREYRSGVRAWKDFIQQTVDRAWGNRFVFSCRSLDYSTPLSSPSLRVPQIRLDPLSNRQVRQYLKLYSPRHWADIWEHISGSDQVDMFRSPFFLKLLVDQVRAAGTIPEGRAGLFTGFVRQALQRELERDSPVFDDEQLLTTRDRQRIVAGRWDSAVQLPSQGVLMPALGRLAYGMQASVAAGEGRLVGVDYDNALDLIATERPDQVIAAGVALGVLDERELTGEVTFMHQLVQEYFAARHFATRPDFDLMAAPWRVDEVAVPVAKAIAALSPADPLPPLPGTGWEETALLAAPMAADTGQFLRDLAEVNLVLAGRCAALPELGDRVKPTLREDLRARLVERSRAGEADLRARIASGLTLGELGGPRFERLSGPHGEYLLPALVPIAGGEYLIGSHAPYEYRGELYDEEVPAGPVELAPFAIGRFAVTNREWVSFMAGGGYDDEQFWPSEEARAWQTGAGTVVNVRQMATYWRSRFRSRPELVEDEYHNDRMDKPMFELWLRRLNMTDEEFDQHLTEYYPEGRRTEPRHWRNPRYNNPMQPVIGISWFEAQAYTLWLAAQSGRPFRLPTEAEWEAAAAGRERRRFAYGKVFDPMKGNTQETHVRGPTPVGVFPEGDTPEGVADLCGNTYDLTSSLWGDDPIHTSWPYPYDPDDGREDPTAPITVSRVGMGGAWYLGEVHARTTYRGRDRYDLRPDEWLTYRGCRVALSLDG